MDYVIRPLGAEDEPILWEILYQGLSRIGQSDPPRDIIRRPEFSRYVQGWGRAGDTGFVAEDKKYASFLGAVWLRKPAGTTDTNPPPELAFAVKPGYRGRGIGSALLTHLVRKHPEQSTISVSFVAGKPVLRLYERFGFKVAEARPDSIIMRRDV